MDELDDMLIDEAVREGGRRCINHTRRGTSTSVPPDRDQAWSDEIFTHYMTKMKPEHATKLHHELLKRADALLRFFDANVGVTDEFPLQVYAESDETMDVFNAQMSHFRAAVGVLTEV